MSQQVVESHTGRLGGGQPQSLIVNLGFRTNSAPYCPLPPYSRAVRRVNWYFTLSLHSRLCSLHTVNRCHMLQRKKTECWGKIRIQGDQSLLCREFQASKHPRSSFIVHLLTMTRSWLRNTFYKERMDEADSSRERRGEVKPVTGWWLR